MNILKKSNPTLKKRGSRISSSTYKKTSRISTVITPVCLQEITECFHIAAGNLIQAAVVKLKKPVQPPDIIFNLVLWNSFCLLEKGLEIIFIGIHGDPHVNY